MKFIISQNDENHCEIGLKHDYLVYFIQGKRSLHGTHNAARKMIEGFSYVADTLSSVSAKPAKMISEWTADQIAPSYWMPNSLITVSFNLCNIEYNVPYFVIDLIVYKKCVELYVV